MFTWLVNYSELLCKSYRQQFLEPGESVLMISMVKKLQKLTSKKVQLILTNKPKLIYVDPSKLIVKGNIIWSDNPNDLSIQVTSPSHFKICTVSFLFSLGSCNTITICSILEYGKQHARVFECWLYGGMLIVNLLNCYTHTHTL